MKAVIYARHSSDRQNQSSSEDQIYRCKKWAKLNGYDVLSTYSDESISGAAILDRQGILSLIDDAISGGFDYIICEDLSRLSRDQEDIASIYKRMEFLNIGIITLSDGAINPLHIGLKGTMNALYLRDLADKTLRGYIAAVMRGQIPGGKKIFGYDSAKTEREQIVIKGKRVVNVDEAEIVKTIFNFFIEGKSVPWIAQYLNDLNIPSPMGKEWHTNTLIGTEARQAGLLRQTLYDGTVTFNKLSYRRNPETNRKTATVNPRGEWVSVPAPELKILDDGVFEKAQEEIQKRKNKRTRRRRTLKARPAKANSREANQKYYLRVSQHKQVKQRYITSKSSFCNHCGSKIIARSGGRLVCSNKECYRNQFLRNDVLQLLHMYLIKISGEDIKASVVTDQDKIDRLDAQINELVAARRELRLNIEHFLDQHIGKTISNEVHSHVDKKEVAIRKMSNDITILKQHKINSMPLDDSIARRLLEMFQEYYIEYCRNPLNTGAYKRVQQCLMRISISHGDGLKIGGVKFDISEMLLLLKNFDPKR